jgi:HAD superfamily hydrolase (TIGR01484 family)
LKKRCNNNLKGRQIETQLQAVFLDYDGTISSLNVLKSESMVSSENMAVLYQISRRIPVVVITTKDLSFVTKRTPFAYAWAGLGGLEIKVGDMITRASCLKKMAMYLATTLEYAEGLLNDDLIIEEKRDSSGATVAFSVDWRQAKNRCKAEEKALKIISYCEKQSVVTIKYEGQPFFDVFPCPISKGKALMKLKQKLGLRNGILYMGDSSVDNAAFKVADIAVGVIHEETLDNLICDYFVKFKDVATFLKGLLKNGFHFSPKLPKILGRSEAFQYIRRR